MTIANALTVNGTLTSSTLNIKNITSSGTITAESAMPSSAFTKAFQMGSSGPFIAFCASTPTAACVPSSIALNVNGSSTTVLYICMPNGGGASSSNWDIQQTVWG